jgi:hypothetical protein
MTITSDQIKFYRSIYVNDSLTNGGRIGPTLMVDNSLNNLFRNIQSSELESGIDLYRKFFVKNENPNDLSLENAGMWISNISSGEDYFQLTVGTDQDNQSSADDYPEWFGSGSLNENIGTSDTSFSVLCKQPSGFPSDSSLILFNGSQQAEVVMLGDPVWNGNLATITLTDEIGLTFLKDETVVSSMLPLQSLSPYVESWAAISLLGEYDNVTYPISLYNIGTITESWTLTFTSSGSFVVTGAITGSVGNGTVDENFAPINGSSYYFNLDKSGWSGLWSSGNTITFQTVHAARGIWVKESVPAGSNSQANNTLQIKLKGESS